MEELEKVLMEAMLMCGERTAEQFGKVQALGSKRHKSTYTSQAVTLIDLENQETILQHLYKHFPGIAISVEERTNDPTMVQAAFYKNDSADTLVQLDPLDGTYCYMNGIRPDYGLIASVVEKIRDNKGRIVSGIMYYPSLEFFIKANADGVVRIKGSCTEKLTKNYNKRLKGQYWCAFCDDNRHLELNTNEQITIPGIYAITQMVLQITNAEIPGFVTANGHLNDHIVGAWMAQKYGCDVEYASGEEFGPIHYGDKNTLEGRKTPRDTKGLLIVGSRGDGVFEKIQSFHSKQTD